MESPSVSFQPAHSRPVRHVPHGALRAGSAAAAVAVVALTGLIAFNGSSSAIPAVDIEQARSVLDLHERQLRQLDSFGHAQSPEVPRGLAAAERTGMPAVTTSPSSGKEVGTQKGLGELE